MAAKNDAIEPLVAEVSDLLYHLIVLLVARGVSLEQIRDELARDVAEALLTVEKRVR